MEYYDQTIDFETVKAFVILRALWPDDFEDEVDFEFEQKTKFQEKLKRLFLLSVSNKPIEIVGPVIQQYHIDTVMQNLFVSNFYNSYSPSILNLFLISFCFFSIWWWLKKIPRYIGFKSGKYSAGAEVLSRSFFIPPPSITYRLLIDLFILRWSVILGFWIQILHVLDKTAHRSSSKLELRALQSNSTSTVTSLPYNPWSIIREKGPSWSLSGLSSHFFELTGSSGWIFYFIIRNSVAKASSGLKNLLNSNLASLYGYPLVIDDNVTNLHKLKKYA